ncbi:WXG100 family type VII secretion target [Streptomyces sp. NPDC007856]|uniref:WXG100 family type VII secretion target n=1 Tax=Streptomyces sp. NPDC007856 TaxID=3364781 RepID=UPI0036B3E6FF
MADAVRVVVGVNAGSAAQQFVAAAGRFSTSLQSVSVTAEALAGDHVWAGAAADRFRLEYREMAAHAEQLSAALRHMAQGARSVIDRIDQEDAAGAAPAAFPAVSGASAGAAGNAPASAEAAVPQLDAVPRPKPGLPPHYPSVALSSGWDAVPAPFNLSRELWSAYDYSPPYADPDGSRYPQRVDAVLSWIEAHQDVINREAQSQGVSPKAIAAVIAWEALNNVQTSWPLPPGTKVLGVKKVGSHYISHRWAGPGKVHFIDSPLLQQVEAGGYLPHMTKSQARAVLSTDNGSIRCIAAIMRAIADTTDRVPFYRGLNARDNVPLLTYVYQGGGPASNLVTWENHLAEKQYSADPQLRFDNPMSEWVAAHPDFLNQAMRPWQPGDAPPPRLRAPGPRPGPAATPG